MLSCAGDEPDIIDGKNLRRLALGYKVPIITTVAGARATTAALKGLKSEKMEQVPLQDYFPEVCCSGQDLTGPVDCIYECQRICYHLVHCRAITGLAPPEDALASASKESKADLVFWCCVGSCEIDH